MRPLSAKKRFVYLALLTLLFLVLVPTVILYASGYRYKPGFGIVQTGGIYILAPYQDALVSVNGKEVGRTGLINRDFYINDLAPSTYAIHVSKEGYYPWYRTLIVEPQIVTEAEVVLIPEDIELTLLTRGGRAATSTKSLSGAQYEAYLAAFELPATSTEKVRGARGGGEIADIENGDVYVRWQDSEKRPPVYFCGRPSYCVGEIAIERGRQRAVSVGYFEGGLVYVTKEGGVFFSEVDTRQTSVNAPLYGHAGADARVVDGRLFIKDGSSLYEVEHF